MTLSNATGGLLGIVFFTKHSQKTGFAFAQYKARKNFLSLRNFWVDGERQNYVCYKTTKDIYN